MVLHCERWQFKLTEIKAELKISSKCVSLYFKCCSCVHVFELFVLIFQSLEITLSTPECKVMTGCSSGCPAAFALGNVGERNTNGERIGDAEEGWKRPREGPRHTEHCAAVQPGYYQRKSMFITEHTVCVHVSHSHILAFQDLRAALREKEKLLDDAVKEREVWTQRERAVAVLLQEKEALVHVLTEELESCQKDVQVLRAHTDVVGRYIYSLYQLECLLST